MSGVRITKLSRSAVPVKDGHMLTVIANTSDSNFLAFPTISAAGKSEMVDQCIAFNRPKSPNFTHATCKYLPQSYSLSNPSNRSVISVTRNDSTWTLNYTNKMSVGMLAARRDTFWIAPAGLAESTRSLNFPSNEVEYANPYNGTNGLCFDGSVPKIKSDAYFFSVGAAYPESGTTQTTKFTSYITTNYLFDITISPNTSTFRGGLKFLTDSDWCFSYMGNQWLPTWETALDWRRPQPDVCVTTEYNDSNAFNSYSSTRNQWYAYIKNDMYQRNQNGYIYAYMPYICVDIADVPVGTTATIGLQYNTLFYGVADAPTDGVYGMIYDNDRYNRTTYTFSKSMFPSDQYTELFATSEYMVYASASMTTVSIYLSTRSGTSITVDYVKQGYVQTSASSYSGSMDQTVTKTGETIDANKYYVYSYTPQDLDSRVKTFTDLVVTHSSKELHMNVIKESESASGNIYFTFQIVRDV